MPLPELDGTCIKLLPTFLFEKNPFRFNELYRFLDDKGFKPLSKPTLSRAQKWGKLDAVIEKEREIQKFFEEEHANFISETIVAQVSHVHLALLLRGLFQLKHEVLAIMNPDKAFQHHLESILYSSIWERFKRWLLENLKENNEAYRKEFLIYIETLINQYKNVVFKPSKKKLVRIHARGVIEFLLNKKRELERSTSIWGFL